MSGGRLPILGVTPCVEFPSRLPSARVSPRARPPRTNPLPRRRRPLRRARCGPTKARSTGRRGRPCLTSPRTIFGRACISSPTTRCMGRRIGELGQLQRHRVHRQRVQATRPQAGGRQRDVLPGSAVRPDRLRQRDVASDRRRCAARGEDRLDSARAGADEWAWRARPISRMCRRSSPDAGATRLCARSGGVQGQGRCVRRRTARWQAGGAAAARRQRAGARAATRCPTSSAPRRAIRSKPRSAPIALPRRSRRARRWSRRCVVARRARYAAQAAGAVAVLFVGLDAMPRRDGERRVQRPRWTCSRNPAAGAARRRRDLERRRGEAVRQAGRSAHRRRDGSAGDRELELRLARCRRRRRATSSRFCPGSDPARATRVRARGRAQRSRRRERHGRRSRFAARGQHGHAPQGANDPVCRPTPRAAAHDRFAHRARAQHSSAASRLDHERRRRRRLGHGRDARDR